MAICLLSLVLSRSAYAQRKFTDAQVMEVHKSAILIDTHNDVTSDTVDGLDIGKARTEGHTDIPRMKQGRMGAQFFAVYVAANYAEGNHAANRTLQMIDTVRHDIIERYPNDFLFATTADDIVKARKQGKIAALLGIEGGHAIEDNLRLLRSYYALGVRYMTLTHTNSNHWADSSGDVEKPNNGLNDFGKRVVLEMNRLGMIVDISHVADKTFYDALEVSKAPIFASHSSCRALANSPRNMTDEMIQAMARKGGVIQINFNCDFLSQKSIDANSKTMPDLMKTYSGLAEKFKNDSKGLAQARRELFKEASKNAVRATLDDVVEHIDHVVKIAGVDSVGLGSDFDGVTCVPIGLEDASKWPNLTRALLEKGYSAADIRKIYGGNTLRLMHAVENTAAKLQKEPVEYGAQEIEGMK